jgi:hypothetical protein
MIIKYFEDDHWWVTSANRLDRWPQAMELTVDDPLITVETLMQVWESDLEGENYHSMTDIPTKLVATLTARGVDQATIKLVLWDIIDSGGWV